MVHAKAFREGTLFSVPLTENIHMVGVVLRKKQRSNGSFVAIFRQALDQVDYNHAVDVYNSRDIMVQTRVTLDSLKSGEWPIIGDAPGWVREEWPIPILRMANGAFSRYRDDNFDLVESTFYAPTPDIYYDDVNYGDIALTKELRRRVL